MKYFKTISILFVFMFILSLQGFNQTVIQMQKEGGVYFVPCVVNSLPLKFIFDTGASDVSISLTEAMFMFKNGLLVESDIIGKESYQNATGAISEGVRVILREIHFGNIKLTNVVASIVLTEEAPLLLGQAVLARIGKYQIDPASQKLIITHNPSNSSSKSLTDVDGNIYAITKIGTQVWMAENLRTTKYSNGEAIIKLENNNSWVNNQEGAYCYYGNDISNSNLFGNLYNWNAVIDSRSLCPYGWHVPSVEEFRILDKYLSDKNLQTGALKSNKQWKLPNESAADYERFAVLPAGKRWFISGDYEFITTGAYLWTSSSTDAQRAAYYAFSFDSSLGRSGSFYRNDGFSCRCIKD